MISSVDLGIVTPSQKKKGKTYKQSANSLFNFMKKSEYLQEILKHKLLAPRYCEEDIGYLKNDHISRIAFPMKCFCDIYLNKLIPHMKIYGKYGIALTKKWGIKNKVQPIQYVNTRSQVVSNFKDVLNYCMNDNINKEMKDNVLHNLKFMKPLRGNMPREGKNIDCIFHDEKEWRFVPEFDEEMYRKYNISKIISDEESLNNVVYNDYSSSIKIHPELCLSLEFSDIKYLIVENEQDRLDIIKFILEECDAGNTEKYILISKILVFDELREDW